MVGHMLDMVTALGSIPAPTRKEMREDSGRKRVLTHLCPVN